MQNKQTPVKLFEEWKGSKFSFDNVYDNISEAMSQEFIKGLQAKIYKAYMVSSQGQIPEETDKKGIPKEYSDGIVGPKTKELFKKFKEELTKYDGTNNKEEWEKDIDVEPGDEFSEYEVKVAEWMLKNVDVFIKKGDGKSIGALKRSKDEILKEVKNSAEKISKLNDVKEIQAELVNYTKKLSQILYRVKT